MIPIPELALPFPDTSAIWDKGCHFFKHNDAPEEGDAATLRSLERGREMHVANISAIDTRMEMLAAQLRDLESKKKELAQRVTLFDSVLHIIQRLPDDVLTEIFLACCTSPTYTGEEFLTVYNQLIGVLVWTPNVRRGYSPVYAAGGEAWPFTLRLYGQSLPLTSTRRILTLRELSLLSLYCRKEHGPIALRCPCVVRLESSYHFVQLSVPRRRSSAIVPNYKS